MSGLAAGALLQNRYRIVRAIGQGGMAAVYAAVDTRLENVVAVKQSAATDSAGLEAFEREARILAGLRHSALPVVIDYFAETAGLFLVMQLIDGDDLSRLLRYQGVACTEADVIVWARRVLEALIYLHEHDPPVVHRDIKPGNLRRTPNGEIVLIDFGLAKRRAADETHLAGEASVFGYTPRYSPPEQIAGSGTEPRSDLYALGATLYHLVTGLAPPGAGERLFAVRNGGADLCRPAHVVLPRVSERLSAVIARAMAIDPMERFASARDMLDALGEAPRAGVTQPRASEERAAARRVDAAMPSQVEVGRQVDLLVQVRFADSPLLGLEDWRARRRPERIEQASEALRLSYPTDPTTGEKLPARVRIRLSAPGAVVAGGAERAIDVPPDDYSTRVAFLLAARRPGTCRVNVEVYSADNVFLGSAPIETQGVGAAVAEPDLRVANLVLEVLARTHESLIAERLVAADGAMRAPAPSFDSIGAVLGSGRMAVDEMPRVPASAPVAPADRPSTYQRRIRKVALVTPILFAAFGVGWLMLSGRQPALAPLPPAASAPGTQAPPEGKPISETSAGSMPPSPVADPSLARLAPMPSVEERAILTTIAEHQRELLEQLNRATVAADATFLVHCRSSKDPNRPDVVFESATRARVTCVYSTSGEKKQSSTGYLVLEKRDQSWRVVSERSAR